MEAIGRIPVKSNKVSITWNIVSFFQHLFLKGMSMETNQTGLKMG